MPKKDHARVAARAAGERTYVPAKPCHKGHRLRRTSNRNCVECKAMYDPHWQAENPVEWAAQASLNSARFRCRALGLPDPLPKSYPRERLLAFFARVVAIRKRGVRVEVDHRIPLALGGRHTVSNLQILTPEQHRAKSLRDRARIAAAQGAA